MFISISHTLTLHVNNIAFFPVLSESLSGLTEQNHGNFGKAITTNVSADGMSGHSRFLVNASSVFFFFLEINKPYSLTALIPMCIHVILHHFGE